MKINDDQRTPAVFIGIGWQTGRNGNTTSERELELRHSMISPRLTPMVTASVLEVAPNFEMMELT